MTTTQRRETARGLDRGHFYPGHRKRTMKQLLLCTLACLTVASSVSAKNFSGSMRGTAFASTLDLNVDGITGRDVLLPTINDAHFASVDASVDTGLVAYPRLHPDWVEGTNGCPLPTDWELTASGFVSFIEKGSKAAVLLEVDESVHLCFTPGNEELVELFVVSAVDSSGIEATATGTAQIRLRDTVMRYNPITGFPDIVLTTGDYDLNVFYEDD